MSYTTATLLQRVRQKAMLPDSDGPFDNEAILAVADDVIALRIVPAILATGNDYLLTYSDFVTPSLTYDIPNRAVGLKIKDVTLVDESSEQALSQIDDLLDSKASGYFLRGNTIHFNTAPTKTVRVYYHLKPSLLVELSKCAVIQSNPVGNDVTVVSLPDNIVSGDIVDFVKSVPDYSAYQTEQIIQGVAGTVLTMTSTPLGIAGAYVCETGCSPVIPLPQDLMSAMEWACAAEILDSQGDFNASERASKRADRGLAAGIRILDPRVDGVKSRKIINRDSELRYGSRNKTEGTWFIR